MQFSPHAIAAILRPIIGTRLDPLFEKVELLISDGTIDRAAGLLQLMAQNGTFDELILLSARLKEQNELLREIRDEYYRDVEPLEFKATCFKGSDSENGGTVVALGAAHGAEQHGEEPGSCTDDAGYVADERAGMPGQPGTD